MGNRVELIWANCGFMSVGQQMQEHSHSCHQLYYVLYGDPVFIVGEEEFHAHAGNCFVIPAGMRHRMLSLQTGPFHSYELKLYLKDYFLAKHLQVFRPPLEDNGIIEGMLSYVVENWTCHDTQNLNDIDYILSSLLMRFFINQIHYKNKGSRHIISDNYNDATHNMLVYIEHNFSYKFSLKQMSEELHYNKNYLCSTFRKNTGVAMVDYLNFIRIRHAVIYFAFYGQDIATTYESTGFNSGSHFSRTFRKLVGISPRSFRIAFSSTSDMDIANCFKNEPILNYQLCTMTEAFESLRNIGEIAKRLLNAQRVAKCAKELTALNSEARNKMVG